MGGSLRIGNVFGIPVRLHWMFLLLLYAYPFVADVPPLVALGGLLLLFGTVFLHELGHSLMARRFGIHVIDITLWPLGGMARLSDMPENPRVEGVVAIAGPAVNGALALLALPLIPVAGILGLGSLANLALFFFYINVAMGLFNLVPAFPMDGGRILRAWFARREPWLHATERAVAVGRACAVLMFFAWIGLWFAGYGSCMLPLVAIFVWFAGARELLGVRLRHGQGVFGPGAGYGFEGPFARPSAPDTGGDFGPDRGGGYASVEPEDDDDPPRGPRRPPSGPGGKPRGGFSELYVRKLEEYRGRLRDR